MFVPEKWLLILLIFVTIIIIYVKYAFSYWEKKKVPFLKPRFPCGNFENPFTTTKSQGFHFKAFYNEFRKMGVKYGGVYTFLSPIFMPVEPEFIKDVLVRDFSNFHARGFYNNEKDQPMSANLFTVDGPKWKHLRAKFTSAFTSGKIKTMFHTMTNCTIPMTQAILESIKKREPINIKEVTAKYTTDIIGSCAFGVDCNSFKEGNAFLLNTTKCIEESSKFARIVLLNTFPNLCRFLKLGLFTDTVLEYFANIITNSLEYRKKNSVRRNDFLQILKDMQDNDADFNITLQEIQAQCFIFFLAGYETSSTTLMFILFELSKHPNIQDKVRKEIDDIFKKHGDFTYEALNEMKYLDCVIDEALRLYPPLPVVIRQCVNNYNITGTDIVLEKGTNVIIPILGLHKDAEYFPNPERFDPDRFLAKNTSEWHRYVYLPFGEGPRNCIGSRFGMLQVKVGLSHLLSKFIFSVNKDTDIILEYTTQFVLKPSKNILLDVKEL